MFHKEGHKIIAITFILVAAAIIIAQFYIDIYWLKTLIQVVFLFILVLILQFFRNPKRTTQITDENIIAPVDGKVVVIEEVFEKEYFKDPDKFIPDRWTTEMEESYYAISFNQGPQRCPAKELVIFLCQSFIYHLFTIKNINERYKLIK